RSGGRPGCLRGAADSLAGEHSEMRGAAVRASHLTSSLLAEPPARRPAAALTEDPHRPAREADGGRDLLAPDEVPDPADHLLVSLPPGPGAQQVADGEQRQLEQ